MLGVAMSAIRWVRFATRLPGRAFSRLSDWAWWTFDDSGRPMPKKARRAAAGASVVLASAAVGASALHWIEPGRAAILWGWFTILAIAGSAYQASRQNRPKKPARDAAGAPAPSRPFKQRLRAFPREALAASGVAARGACVSIRRSAPGHAAKAWRCTRSATRVTARGAYRGTKSLWAAIVRAASRNPSATAAVDPQHVTKAA